MDNPTVSAIVAVYNAELYITECLDSIFTQTYLPHEVIIIDDGSTDGTLKILESYPQKIRLYSRENRGVSATLNEAIGYVTGQYIAILDADDLWVKDKLELQVAHLEINKNLDACFTMLQQFISPELDEVSKLRFLVPDSPQSGIMKMSMLTPKITFDKFGLFNENIPSCDFIDWVATATRNGFRYEVLPEILAYRRISVGSMSQRSNYQKTLLDVMRNHLVQKRIKN